MYGQGHSFYYVSADETQWKEIAELVNRVYDSCTTYQFTITRRG